MDEMVYNSLSRYYHVLETTGYMSQKEVEKLLLLSFYKDFVYSDFRGLLSGDDYHYIERALDCLYGSTCLIPYPDYLKMGKLKLGDTTELSHRIKTLEDTNVVKVIHDLGSVENEGLLSDIIVVADEG